MALPVLASRVPHSAALLWAWTNAPVGEQHVALLTPSAFSDAPPHFHAARDIVQTTIRASSPVHWMTGTSLL